MKNNIIFLLITIVLLVGCAQRFTIHKLPDYQKPRYYGKTNVPIIYDINKINNIKSNKEDYIQIAIVTGKNYYGSPQLDETFTQYVVDICNKLNGDMALYELDKSDRINKLHSYTIVKKKPRGCCRN